MKGNSQVKSGRTGRCNSEALAVPQHTGHQQTKIDLLYASCSPSANYSFLTAQSMLLYYENTQFIT